MSLKRAGSILVLIRKLNTLMDDGEKLGWKVSSLKCRYDTLPPVFLKRCG